MRRIVVGLFMLCCLHFGFGLSYAEDSTSVKAEINKGFITIGERVQCTVLIRHSKKVRLISAIDFPNTRDFEVKTVREIPVKEINGLVTEGRRFEITAYGLGEFVINAIPIRYLNEQNEEKEIRTNRLYVTVESVDKNGQPKLDIRGIKGPMGLRLSLRPWLMGVLLVIFCALIGFGVWLKWIRKKDIGEAEGVLLSAHDEAYQALQRLYDSSLIREGKVKEYYFRLSDIIRHYLERRFNFAAVEKTTDEIAKDLLRIDVDDSTRHFMKDFLEEVDIVKFAKYSPEPQEIIRINRSAKEIVDKTKVVEQIPSLDASKTV